MWKRLVIGSSLIVCLIISTLFSCTSNNQKQFDTNTVKKLTSVANCLNDSLVLLDTTKELKWFNNLPDTFTRIPQAFCGIAPLCEYRMDKNDWDKRFLISEGDSGLAMILIKKKLVLLKYDFVIDSIEEYSNATYTVTIVITKLDSVDEGSIDKEGTVTIKSKVGETEIRNFYGDCSP
jgi:hypothetical protein